MLGLADRVRQCTSRHHHHPSFFFAPPLSVYATEHINQKQMWAGMKKDLRFQGYCTWAR